MAKLYYDPDHHSIDVRADDDRHGIDKLIEITAEQAAAISLSGIRFALIGLCESLDEHLPSLKR